MADFDVPAGLPFPPMEAELVRELPEGSGWQYEPKWDGFRGVLENLEGELRLWSRNGRPLRSDSSRSHHVLRSRRSMILSEKRKRLTVAGTPATMA